MKQRMAACCSPARDWAWAAGAASRARLSRGQRQFNGGGAGGLTPEGLEPLPYSWSYEWGAGTWPLDTETCVLFVLKNEEDHDLLKSECESMHKLIKELNEQAMDMLYSAN